jgi:hypothetical protein
MLYAKPLLKRAVGRYIIGDNIETKYIHIGLDIIAIGLTIPFLMDRPWLISITVVALSNLIGVLEK